MVNNITGDKPLKPRHCDIAISHQCILQCKMCNTWMDKLSFQDPGWLKLEDYKKLLYGLKGFVDEPFYVSFGGGETLLNPRLFEIAKICKELEFRCCFPTNGYLLDREMTDRVAEAGIFSIGISLDGIERETQDFLRGKEGCWDRVMQAIALLHKNCPQVIVNILTIIMGRNMREITALTGWVCTNPYLGGIIFHAIQRPFGSSCPDNWFELEEYKGLWPQDNNRFKAVIDELIDMKLSGTDNGKIVNSAQQLEMFKLYFADPYGFIKPAKCHLGEVLRITWNGNVLMCDKAEPIGNIKDSGIREIWHSLKADSVRKGIDSCAKNCHELINCFEKSEK